MKKSWHPGLIKNRAQVWEDQHAALHERKRIEALKKEIEEERAANDLRALNEAAGAPKRQERVEFLYAGPGAGSSISADREAYLLGKKRIDEALGKDSVGQEIGQVKKPESGLSGGLNLRDVSNKVSMDPLLAIKKQEAAQYEAMINKKKAEMEMEARKVARREARGGTSRHSSSRQERAYGSSHRDKHDLHRSYSRRSPERDSRRDKYNGSDDESDRRRRSRRRSGSRDRPRSSRTSRDLEQDGSRSYRDRDTHRSRSRSRERRRRHSRTSSKSPRHRMQPTLPASHQASGEMEAATRAAKLAEMSAAASELDSVRERRLQEAARRDEMERSIETRHRDREAQVGRTSMLSTHLLGAGTKA